MADDDRDTRPPGPSMRALLAACDAARALSTPPPAPPADSGGAEPAPRRGDERDAA